MTLLTAPPPQACAVCGRTEPAVSLTWGPICGVWLCAACRRNWSARAAAALRRWLA